MLSKRIRLPKIRFAWVKRYPVQLAQMCVILWQVLYIWGFFDCSKLALKVGEGSRLRCWLWVLDGLDRSPVEWRLNGSSVQPWQAQISEGSLTLLNATHSMEGNYSCHDVSGTLLQIIKLRLGRKSTLAIQESLVSTQSMIHLIKYVGCWKNLRLWYVDLFS